MRGKARVDMGNWAGGRGGGGFFLASLFFFFDSHFFSCVSPLPPLPPVCVIFDKPHSSHVCAVPPILVSRFFSLLLGVTIRDDTLPFFVFVFLFFSRSGNGNGSLDGRKKAI